MNGIAEMRKKSGMRQQELADSLHVDRSTVAKWETGAAFPTARKLPQLASALGCTVDDLINNGEADDDHADRAS